MKTIFETFGGAYRQAGEMFERLVLQLKREEGLTEQLKATDSLDWVSFLSMISRAFCSGVIALSPP